MSAMVEQLFESRTIEQIRELEREKRRQIEEKKEEMKETVGARYRDIIESADSITEMRDCCRAMVKAGDAMQLHCDAVNSATRRIQEFAALAVQSTTNTSSVVAMGHSVNFLLDTPSHIWTCMDEHRQLDATLRFLSSQRVHTELTRSHADHATLVPWLASHWQENVLDFRAKLARSCRARLRRIGLDAQEYTNLLVSLMLVEGCKAEEMFALVLSNSQSWLSRCTDAFSAHPQRGEMGQLKKYVASISRCIASTLCVVHVLFVGEEVTSAEARGLLSECHAHALLRARATGGGTSDIEANVGVAHTLVQQQCSRWLSECAATVSSKHEWSLPATTISHLNELSGAIGAKADACLERVMPYAATWPELWSSLLLPPVASPTTPSVPVVGVWGAVFRSPFLQRARHIVSVALNFQNVFHTQHVEPWLARLAAGAAPAGSNVGGYMWARQRAALSGALLQSSVGQGGHVSAGYMVDAPASLAASMFQAMREDRTAQGAMHGLTRDVVQLCTQFDAQMQQAIGDASSLGDGDVVIPELWLVLRSTCSEALSAWIDTIEERISQLQQGTLPQSQQDADGAPVASGLALARLLTAIGQHSRELPRLLSEEGGGEDAQGLLLAQVQRRMASLSVRGYEAWSRTVITQASETLANMVENAATQAFKAQRRGWQEISIKDEEGSDDDDDGLGGGEETFTLPGSCTPQMFSFLFSLCTSIHRAGSHTLPRAAVVSISREAIDCILETVQRGLDAATAGGAGTGVSDSEGMLLQLLFDLRFAAYVLRGAQEEIHTRRIAQLESELAAEIDPVDWATYEAHLWHLVQQHYERSAVMFGALVQLQRMHFSTQLQSTSSSGSAGQGKKKQVTMPTQSMLDADLRHSAVPIASLDVPRFNKLPVSMPASQASRSGGGKAGGKQARGAGYTARAASGVGDGGVSWGGLGDASNASVASVTRSLKAGFKNWLS